MVSGGTHGPPGHRPPMSRRRFVPGQSARHSSSSLSSSDGSDEEHISKNGGGKYLHLVIPSNLHPGQEGNDCEERQRSEEEGSMARSGCTLDRFGDLGIDEEEDNADDNGNHDVKEVESDDEEDGSAVEKEGKVNAEESGCGRLDADVMYDDEGNRIEFMYDDEGNRVEKIDQEDDDIIWQDDEEEVEETERIETLTPRPREGLPPLAPPKVRSNRADIRERFNQTGQSWLRTKQLLNRHQEQNQSQEQDGSAELESRRLYLSDSDSTEEVVEEEREHASSPQMGQKQFSEQRHVRFANVVDTRVFLAEEEVDVDEVGEDEGQEPPQTQPRREKAASRIESMRMALEDNGEDSSRDDAQRVDVEEEDDESEVYNTRNFDEEDEVREDVDADSVLNGEMIDFSFSRGSTVADDADKPGMHVSANATVQTQNAYGLKPPPRVQAAFGGADEDEEEVGGSFYFLESPRNVSQRPAEQVAEGKSRKKSERPPRSPKAPTSQSKTSDLSDLYDGNVGDVGSILNDLQGIEVGKADTACVAADDDNIDGVEEVSSNAPVANDNSNNEIGRETSASPTERDCMKLNDDVLRSYQLMKEREEQQLEIELQDTATTNQRKKPADDAQLTSPKGPKEMHNPRNPYRHGHSLGDEVSDIFSEMSSLGPWNVFKKMEGYTARTPQVVSPKQHQDYQENIKMGAFRNSELNSSEENVLPSHQGWVRQDISLDDSMGDSLVGKMLTLVPSPRANPSMLSTPFDDEDDAENDDKPKRRRWPFGKKKKQKDDQAHTASHVAVEREKKDYRRSTELLHGRQSVHRQNHVEERDSLEYYRYEFGEDEVGHRSDSFGNVRDEPQTLYDIDRCQTDDNLEMHHGRVHGPEYYQRQVEENALQLHMAADNAALQLIQNEQQRRAKKQDLFRQEMEDRAREEEEALRQQEAAVLQAINSGNQDDLAAILSSNSQWAPDVTLGDASGNYARPSQQQASSSFLQSFVQGELCTSENAKFIEGKAKQIAEVLREAFEDDSASDMSDYPEEGYRAKYAYA